MLEIAPPASYQEYLNEVKSKLSLVERKMDKASGLDERIDITNRLLIETVKLLSEGLKLQLPSVPHAFPGIPPYNVRKFDLSVAKTKDAPQEIQLPGDALTFYTDGSYEGIEFALTEPTNDWVPVREFGNPYHYPATFDKFYISWTAQVDKYLRIHIGREAGADAMVQISNPEVIPVANPDVLLSLDLLHVLDRSLNDFYLGNRVNPGVPTIAVAINDYYNSANEGLTLPADILMLSFSSRAVFSYPTLNLDMRYGLPAVDGTLSEALWALWQAWEYPCVTFYLLGTGYAFGIIRGDTDFTTPSITALLPADYVTGHHTYTLKVNKPNCEFWCDKKPLGIAITGLPESIPSWAGPPYCLFGTVGFMDGSFSYGGLILNDGNPAHTVRTAPFAFNHLSIYSSSPLPSRQYALYNENTSTKWNAQAVASGTITSHPVPVWGYPIKTLHFMANGAGSLVIQEYVGGGWRDVTTVAISANTLNIQEPKETPIIRCTFTPTSYPTTVTAAEVYIS